MKCKTCKYFVYRDDMLGRCHRRAYPFEYTHRDKDGDVIERDIGAEFLLISDDDWCGEWEDGDAVKKYWTKVD